MKKKGGGEERREYIHKYVCMYVYMHQPTTHNQSKKQTHNFASFPLPLSLFIYLPTPVMAVPSTDIDVGGGVPRRPLPRVGHLRLAGIHLWGWDRGIGVKQ